MSDQQLTAQGIVGRVSCRPGEASVDGEADRWQVLIVGGGGIIEICGFDNRDAAAARAAVGLAD